MSDLGKIGGVMQHFGLPNIFGGGGGEDGLGKIFEDLGRGAFGIPPTHPHDQQQGADTQQHYPAPHHYPPGKYPGGFKPPAGRGRKGVDVEEV
jgi:hypothetical protein